MKIAIVDDLDSDRELLYSRLCDWAERNSVPLVPLPDRFTCGEELLESFEEGCYDIIFLDVYMGDGITGMQTAYRLREKDTKCRIIFTTTSTEFAVESYEVASSFYLVKPYEAARLESALQRCGADIIEREQFFSVQTKEGEKRIHLHDIAYTEYEGRQIAVTYKNGESIRIPMKHGELSELLLQYPYFCDCIKGVLVNFEAVDKITEDSFQLHGGKLIPISRLKYRTVREQFLSYVYSRTRGG